MEPKNEQEKIFWIKILSRIISLSMNDNASQQLKETKKWILSWLEEKSNEKLRISRDIYYRELHRCNTLFKEQFIEFFVGVTLGREGIKPATKEHLDANQTLMESMFDDPPSEEVPDVLNIIRSESITRRSKVKNKQTINEHTSSISQTVNSSQKVKIKSGTRPI